VPLRERSWSDWRGRCWRRADVGERAAGGGVELERDRPGFDAVGGESLSTGGEVDRPCVLLLTPAILNWVPVARVMPFWFTVNGSWPVFESVTV